jgi:hypothetical protein
MPALGAGIQPFFNCDKGMDPATESRDDDRDRIDRI